MDLKNLLINFYTSHLNWTCWTENNDAIILLKTYITLYIVLFQFYFFLTLITLIGHWFFNKTNTCINLYYLSILINMIAYMLVFLKLYWIIKLENNIFPSSYEYKVSFLQSNQNLGIVESTLIFPNFFGDFILFLSIYIGIVRINLLKYNNLFKSISNFTLFSIINLLILIIITTNNLLIIFLVFNIIFMWIMIYTSTANFTHNTQSIKQIDKTLKYKLYKALIGLVGILTALLYIYIKYNTLNCYHLSRNSFTKREVEVLIVVILYWFYRTMSIIFFYCWWLYRGVKFSSTYSLFLSGFLVLSTLIALYCIYMFILSLRLGLSAYIVNIYNIYMYSYYTPNYNKF